MIIKPKVRGFICTNAHPAGCAAHVQQQIDYIRQQGEIEDAPKRVLVIGSSTGYGLASRITAAFGGGASTIGVFFEKPGTEKRTGTAGWYNTFAFQQAAEAEGLYSKNINGDAFSNEIKQKTVDLIKQDLGQVDLVVYSLASPRRTDPVSGETFNSTLKPIGQAYTAKNLNTSKELIEEVTLEAASDEDIANTIKVMGGEDWELWMAALSEAGVLSDNCRTVAYSYIGEQITKPIYGHATIGRAKDDMDRAAETLRANGTEAHMAVLKALVTQASSAIPIMPLYLSLLFKVMKEQGSHEGCIEQIHGLFDQMYVSEPVFDDKQRLRVDYKELAPEVQQEVERLWDQATTENFRELGDYACYQAEFLQLFGFGIDGVDYDADVSPLAELQLV